MKKLTFITGGQRSGKSNYAQNLALQLSARPVYLATSRVWDKEHALRIERHQAERGEAWVNIEEEKMLSKHNFNKQCVVLDCVTLWATNFFYDNDADVQGSLNQLKNEFDQLIQQDAHFIIISNEIGMGEMSANALQRKFADLQGWLNQYIAAKADELIFMVSGIPMKIK